MKHKHVSVREPHIVTHFLLNISIGAGIFILIYLLISFVIGYGIFN